MNLPTLIILALSQPADPSLWTAFALLAIAAMLICAIVLSYRSSRATEERRARDLETWPTFHGRIISKETRLCLRDLFAPVPDLVWRWEDAGASPTVYPSVPYAAHAMSFFLLVESEATTRERVEVQVSPNQFDSAKPGDRINYRYGTYHDEDEPCAVLVAA